MNWIKILNFIDGIFPLKEKDMRLGTLYKIKGEELPFRYIQYTNHKNRNNKIFYFKHHQLKQYAFKNLSMIEREANKEEIKIYNLIKEHVNEIARKNIYTHNN